MEHNRLHRITPAHIYKLNKNEIFVFGSNLAGRHGAGAALTAKMKFGAKIGKGIGLTGQSYAIPTKDERLRTLNIETIEFHINEFIEFAKTMPTLTFFVTPIGCGLAGYEPNQIAPLFQSAMAIETIFLPYSFWEYINN